MLNDVIQNYLDVYDEEKALEAQLKGIKERKEVAKQTLINTLTSNGLDSAAVGDRSVTLTSIAYSKVVDYDALMDWVYDQGEPISEYTDTVFKKKVLNDIVREKLKEAIETETNVQSILPQGLDVGIQQRVTVRARSGKTASSKLDKLKSVLGNDVPF